MTSSHHGPSPLRPQRSGGGPSVLAFAGLSVLVHIGASLGLPESIGRAAQSVAAPPSFFELEPLVVPVEPPAPAVVPEPTPAPEPEPLRPRQPLAVRDPAPPTDAPPSQEPDASPDASTVVADTEGTRQEASVVSTEGGLATSLRAGSGGGGAVVGTRHEGPIGVAPQEAREARREDLAALLRPYLRQVRGELLSSLRAPRQLGREAEARVVKLGVTIDAQGRIVSVRLRESCGTQHLDELALASVRAVAQVSAPPNELPWAQPRELTFPIAYR